jgi:hypothetical protein
MLKRMIFTGAALSLITPLFAADGALVDSGTIALFIAIMALTVAIINFFRIKRVRRIHDVDFMNQKDDFSLTLERFKASLNQEYRGNRRDFQKSNPSAKPAPQKQVPVAAPINPKVSNEQNEEPSAEVVKKAKKRYYHRRKPGGNRPENSQSPKE